MTKKRDRIYITAYISMSDVCFSFIVIDRYCYYLYYLSNVVSGLRSSVEKKTHRHFFCPSDPQNCRNPNRYTSSECSAWGCPNLWSAVIMRKETQKTVPVKPLKGWISAWSVRTRKPTSEVDRRDPGSSHMDWLHWSFMMRNRVTSSKPLLIF